MKSPTLHALPLSVSSSPWTKSPVAENGRGEAVCCVAARLNTSGIRRFAAPCIRPRRARFGSVRLYPRAASLLALCFLGLALISARAARAEDPNKAINRATELNKKALELYSDGDFDKARQLLKQALDLCASSGLDSHPIAARTHIHLGVVMVGGLNQHDLALKQFRKAIEIQPDIQVTHNVATPEVLAAFKEAADSPNAAPAGEGGCDGAPPAAADDAPPAGEGEGPKSGGAPATGIIHTPVTRAKAGSAVLITCRLGSNVTGFQKVVLGFKGVDDDGFTTKDMARAGGKFASQIPATSTTGKTVAYYIEAQDAEGTVLAAAGGESRPLTVALGAGKTCAEGDDACEEGAGGGTAGPPFFIGLMGGFGFGYATGHADLTSVNQVKAGFALASLLHVAPELGYFINPDFRVSLQARLQFVTGPTPLDMNGVHQPAKFGFAALARGSWFFGDGPLRPYVSAALGGGQIRHVVVFTGASKLCGTNGGKTCVDTVTPGPLLFGGGAGLTYALSETFGLVAEANTLFGLPKFTFHIDLNAGLSLRF